MQPTFKVLSAFLILYSDDLTHIGSCVSPYRKKEKGELFTEDMIIADVDEVADAGADIHMLQPGLGWMALWKSNVLPFEEHYAWTKKRYGSRDSFFDRYMLNGGDIVGAFVRRCRERGTQPYISLRMNDYHDKCLLDFSYAQFQEAPKSVTLSASRFQDEHRDWRIGPEPEGTEQMKTPAEFDRDNRLKWQTNAKRVMNWAIPEVRQHKLDFITELCENYDIDGFELDFMRHSLLFRTHETTSRQRREIMTGFCKTVREILDRTSPEGKRRRLCVRIPHHSAAHDALGIDIAAWHAAGVDMFNLSCHYCCEQQTQLAKLAALAPGAEFFLEMTQTPLRLHGRGREQFRMTTREQFVTSASVAAAQGASGISLFNFMYYRAHGERPGVFVEPPFDVFRPMKTAMVTPPVNQHYFVGPGSDAWGVKDFVLPKHLRRDHWLTFPMTMVPSPGGWKKAGRLRIQTQGSCKGRQFKIFFNGTPLSETDDVSEPFPDLLNNKDNALGFPDELRAWTVPVDQLKEGLNEVQLTLTAGEPVTITFVDLGMPGHDTVK